MSGGKASDWKVRDESRFDGMVAKRPLDGSFITLSSNTTTTAALVGDVVGTLSITAAYVGTPHWQLVGQSNFSVNATTGVVTVASTLSAGSEDIKVKVKGTTPPISSPTFAIDITGGGGGSYVAKAVHFDGSNQGGGPTYLSIDSLTAVDSKFGGFSVWVAGLFVAGNNRASFFQSLILPDGNSTGISAVCGIATFTPRFNASGGAQSVYTTVSDVSYPGVGWFHLLGAANTETGAMVYYINDELVTPGEYDVVANGTPFLIQSNGLPFIFGDDTFGDGPTFDCADAWVGQGVQLISDDGLSIPEATRRLFISATGKPVNPSGFPSSPVLFSGDASTFATNQGTGGAFTLTGVLTNATTSPSD